MIHMSVLRGFFSENGLEVSKKAANVQRKTLKDLEKAWRTITQDHFKRLQESLAAWKQNILKMKERIKSFHCTVILLLFFQFSFFSRHVVL